MKVGVAQVDIILGDRASNLEKCLRVLRDAAEKKVEMLVFPECSLTGYVYNDFDHAFDMSETVPGESTDAIQKACSELGISCVFGLLERDNQRIFNTMVFLGGDGFIESYRKTHLLVLGVDRYVSPGDELSVFPVGNAAVGILTCYDMRFPEAARVLALKGAQVIIHPANIFEPVEAYADFLDRARACENRVFVIHANRVGQEGSVWFLGRSQIIDCEGRILVEAGKGKEEMIMAEIEPIRANVKHAIKVPGEYEYDLIGDRRSDLYSIITGSNPAGVHQRTGFSK